MNATLSLRRTIPDALHTAAERWPDRTAIVDGDATVSFVELLERVRSVSASLQLSPGDRVCIWAPNSWQWQVCALAVTYAGGVLVPMNTRYTGHEVAEIISRVSARLVIVEHGFLGRTYSQELADVLASAPPIVDVAELASSTVDASEPSSFPGADDVADILFTSGTTGRSKGVKSSHAQSLEAARIWGEIGEVTEDDRYLVVNPYFHSFGYKAGILVSLTYGATLYPMRTYSVSEALQLIQDQAITVLPGAPTIFQTLLDAPDRSRYDLTSLRLAVTGAAMVPVTLVERMQSELSFDLVLTAFGMTECVMGAMGRPGDPLELVASTTGRVVPGMEMRIDAPEGEDGELLFRGPLVMQGYLDDEAATAEAIDQDGWLHTGDVGRTDREGNLTITDRLKDVYISGGFNVYPAEVEQVIARLDGVVESAVIGMPDERLGEVGHAYVVRSSEQLSDAAVIAWCKERLANFKVPRTVTFISALPRNMSGKVLKTELRR